MTIVSSTGYMIVNAKETRGWGVAYYDGREGDIYDWCALTEAKIYDTPPKRRPRVPCHVVKVKHTIIVEVIK